MTTTTTMLERDELRKALKQAGLKQISDDILSKCVALALTLQLTTKQMVECWEAFSLNRNIMDLVNDSTFQSYRNELIKESNATTLPMDNLNGGAIVSRSAAKRHIGTPPSATSSSLSTKNLPMVTPPSKRLHLDSSSSSSKNNRNVDDNDLATTTISPSRLRSSHSTPLPTATNNVSADNTATATATTTSETITTPNHTILPEYNTRANVGQVVVTFNPSNRPPMNNTMASLVVTTNGDGDAKRSTATSAPSCCRIQWNPFDDNNNKTNVTKSYRHMFTTMEERAHVLNQQLVQLGQVIEDYYDFEEEGDNNNNHHKETSTMVMGGEYACVAPVGVPRQDKVTCIGRICNEAHQGRINPASVVIEGSKFFSGGARNNVDLSLLLAPESKLPFSLFPGQVVAIEGLNPTGRKLIAHRIVSEGVPHPPLRTPVSQLLPYYYPALEAGLDVEPSSSSSSPLPPPPSPLVIMCVSGPYTTSTNLDYEPLTDLLAVIVQHKPHVVIMTGPFVDMNHPDVKNGMTKLVLEDNDEEIYVPFDVFFAHKITQPLEDLYNNHNNDNAGDLNTQFVLVPSLDDATSKWVYPQPPLCDRLPPNQYTIQLPGAEEIEFGTLGFQYVEKDPSKIRMTDTTTKQQQQQQHRQQQQHHHRRIHLVSNPCTFRINEIVVGVTSTDVLLHMSADETNANLPPFSRLARLATHLIQQRSYYPLFPPHPSVNLDLKHIDQWSMPCRPDLLILPSKLQCFAKTAILDHNKDSSTLTTSTVVMNPGRLTRGTTGGTYAVMEIHPIAKETLEQQLQQQQQQNAAHHNETNVDESLKTVLHGLPDRIHVEIKNI